MMVVEFDEIHMVDKKTTFFVFCQDLLWTKNNVLLIKFRVYYEDLPFVSSFDVFSMIFIFIPDAHFRLPIFLYIFFLLVYKPLTPFGIPIFAIVIRS